MFDITIEPMNYKLSYLRTEDYERDYGSPRTYCMLVSLKNINKDSKNFTETVQEKFKDSKYFNDIIRSLLLTSVTDSSMDYFSFSFDLYSDDDLTELFDIVREFEYTINKLSYMNEEIYSLIKRNTNDMYFIEGLQNNKVRYGADLYNIREQTFDLDTVLAFIEKNNFDLTHELYYHSEIAPYINENSYENIAISIASNEVIKLYFNDPNYKSMIKMICPQTSFFDVYPSEYNGPVIYN